ncbi:glycosyltransferase family 4 protein [Methanobacterium sp. 42_16]|uniref:glycosyltransferase family 4 protein n=1 Tax=Methanobacterium sp. 42_16 TaxID=1641383 RepID=UPI0007487D17|nr:glycosyltransferase family 4 protein [Methanobacterium sp. 42_16]KUK75390.1 MAG: Glycosyltransferase [Methanobacterium sp. 42_16]
MKILIALQFLSPKFGGTVTAVYNLSKELSKNGHNVTIITTDFEYDKDYADQLTKKGVKIVKFKCILNIASFLYTPSIKIWLDTHIANYDIIHLHNFRSYQNAMIHKYARKYNVPYILQAHGSLPLIFEKIGLKKLYDFFWGKKLLNDASRVLAVSNVELKQYLSFGVPAEKIEIIPNIIDVERFNNIILPGQFKNEYEIKSRNMILFLGRIHKIKGLDFLINAFKQILDDINDVSLVIVGPDDGYREKLEKDVESLGIKENVVFIEYINNVQNAYFDADILVYPAEYEIFGLVPFEAILCRTLVIVSDDCGCGEIIKKSDSGFLIKYGDVDELSNKMINLLMYPEKGKTKIENGIRYINENLNSTIIFKKIESIYSNANNQ